MMKKLKPIISLLLCAAIMFTACIGGFGTAQVFAESGEETLPDYNVKRYIPEYNKVQLLVDGNAITEGEYAGYNYCAFPNSMIRKNEKEVMFGYARMRSHASSDAHGLLATFDTETNEIVKETKPFVIDGKSVGGNFVKMPNGDILMLTGKGSVMDVGVQPACVARSTDGGETWAYDAATHEDDEYKTLEDSDGVQYHWTARNYMDGNTVYLIVGYYNQHCSHFRGAGKRSDGATLIKTDDNGKTWDFVFNFSDICGGMNLTEEAAMEKLPDGGYLFVIRGFDETVAFTTDENFNLVKKRNLSVDCPEQFGPWCGFPALFEDDGRYYLYCRNVPEKGVEELAFYELDTENLLPKSYVVLEEPMSSNWAGVGTGGDGHYASHYFAERDGVRYINFFSYTDAYTMNPDIVRIECRWDEVSNPVYKEETENNTVYPVARALSHTDSETPVYENELSNLALTFDYDLKESANWYFDVVDGDYNNCYNLALTPDGFTLNRVVGGESTALCTYTDIDKDRYYYHLELVRYMGEITLYSDGVALMSVADGDAQYPVTSTGANTHWKGNVYLADTNGTVSDIKVYDSGLVTFENGVAILGTVPLREDIGVMHSVSATAASVTPNTNRIDVGVSGTNPAVYTEKWLDEDMGDCVITYNARLFETYTSHAIYFGAQAVETPSGGQWFAAENTGSDFKNIFNFADGMIFGWGNAHTYERFVSVTKQGSWEAKVASTKLPTAWGRYEVKIVKKAGKVKVTVSNVLSEHTVYEGDATAIAGNIYFALFQRKTFIKDIKITDTEKIGAKTETVKAVQPVAIKGSFTDNANPIYDTTLSNFSADFIYKAENNATLYFDVVNKNYDNCYALKLTPSGLSLDRVVSGTADTLCSYTGNTAGSIQIVRYMGEITVFIDEIPVMAVASEDVQYPVTSTGANTHWYGNIYLDDTNADVTGIKLYDSGLVTFKGGVAVAGNLKLAEDISMRAVSQNTAHSFSTTQDSIFMTIGGTNKVIHSGAWLDSDVGDFVLTYTDRNARNNWTHKAIAFSAIPPVEGIGSEGIFYAHDNTLYLQWLYGYGDIFVTGMGGGNTFYKIADINSRGNYTYKQGPTNSGMLYGNNITYTVKIVKKAERLTIYMGTDPNNLNLMYDGKSDNIVGNIFYSQFQGTADVKNIKITDTVNTCDAEIAVDEKEILVGDISGDDSVDATDLTLLKKKLLGLDITVDVCKKADVNADRYLDVRDMIRLKKNLTK